MTRRRKRYRLPKLHPAREKTVRRAYRDFVERRPAGMPVGMVQVLVALRQLAVQGIVPAELLSPDCVRRVSGEDRYGETVIANIVHALHTPVPDREFRGLVRLPADLRALVVDIPDINLDLSRLLKERP